MWFLWILIDYHLNQILLIFSCACIVGYPMTYERDIDCVLLIVLNLNLGKMAYFADTSKDRSLFCLIKIND